MNIFIYRYWSIKQMTMATGQKLNELCIETGDLEEKRPKLGTTNPYSAILNHVVARSTETQICHKTVGYTQFCPFP